MSGCTRTAFGEGQSYWFFGMKVVRRTPEGASPIILEHHLDPGAGAPLHFHKGVEDSFYLAAGRLAMRAGDESFVVEPGDYVSVPTGLPHSLVAIGETEAVLIQTHTDPSFFDFVAKASVPGDQPRPDPTALDFPELMAIAESTGHPVIGPMLAPEELGNV